MRKIILASVLLSALSVGAATTVTGLTIEGRQAPSGIDVARPRFGWKIVSDRNNVVQKYYRLIVASSLENLNSGNGDIWDSGKVKSDSSVWVGYKGAALKPNTDYFWKVEVTTNKGRCEWSAPAKWSTGLFDAANWRGSWIGLDSLGAGDSMDKHSRLATRYLRKTFHTGAGVKRAVIHISGLGLYTLYINGRRVGNDVLTPLPTDYTRTVVYDTYDVTGLIQNDNAIGVMLAGGHYFAQRQNYETKMRTTYGFPRLKANLIIEYADGSRQTIATDESWRLNVNGAIRYANEYDGELFDARRELHGWTMPGYDDTSWQHARLVSAPEGTMRGNLAPEMTVYKTEEPVKISRFSGRYIVDFGTNNAGRISLKVKAAAGDTIKIRHAELLRNADSLLYTDNLRSAEATALYVSDGRERQWAPEFTYYGFRYAEISGVDTLDATDIRRELIADRMDDDGNSFYAEESGRESLINRIVNNALRGIRSNYKGMPVDCPQRDERMPWLGDRTTGCYGESFLLDNHGLYAKWVRDICDSQLPDGNISDVAPAYWRLYTGNVTWPAALPFTCDMLYRQYGDLRPMTESYTSIKKFLDFLRNRKYTGGLIKADKYGDWCVPPESPRLIHSKDPSRKTDGVLMGSAYYIYLCRMMSRYAPLTGHAADRTYFDSEADAMTKTFRKTFFHNGSFSNGTVTANLLPLAMGLVDGADKETVTQHLLNTIIQKNNSHISAGVVGIQWLMRYLSDSGNGNLAYRLATNTTYPSWGYMVEKGATTIWELWNGDTANPKMNSGNHIMLLGDFLPWCFERLGGIRSDSPGFRHITVKPDYTVKALDKVRVSHNTPYGKLSGEWIRKDGQIQLTVTIPANTSAKIYSPQGKVHKTGSGTYTFRWKDDGR